MRSWKATTGAILMLAAGLAWLRTGSATHVGATPGSESARSGTALMAGPMRPLLDTDKDGIPDQLEFVTQSNSSEADADKDNRDDFVELVEWTDPTVLDQPNKKANGFRILVNTTDGTTEHPIQWVHLLFRFRSGDMRDLRAMALFADVGGQRIPLEPLIAHTLADLYLRYDPSQGLLVRASLRIPTFKGFRALTPLTFGGYTMINNEVHGAGSVLFYVADLSNTYFTLMPVGTDLTFQTTDATSRTPFWSTQRQCVMTLRVHGVGRSGQVCEVAQADCRASNTRRCPPSCVKMKGQTFFIPDGLSLILGG